MITFGFRSGSFSRKQERTFPPRKLDPGVLNDAIVPGLSDSRHLRQTVPNFLVHDAYHNTF